MGKKKKGNSRRPSKKRTELPIVPQKKNDTSTKPPEAKLNKRLHFWQKFGVVIGIVGSILGLLGVFGIYKDMVDFFKSRHDLYEEEIFVKGIPIPQYINDSNPHILFGYGNFSVAYSKSDLEQGAFFSPNGLACTWEQRPVGLWLRLEDNRLQVYDTIRDIAKGEVIAILNYDKLNLVKSNSLDYYDDDSTLEIVDRQGYVAFSMRITPQNIVSLKGYFITERNIAVIRDSGYTPCIPRDSLWAKEFALEKIKTIKPTDKKSKTDYLKTAFIILLIISIVFIIYGIVKSQEGKENINKRTPR